MNAFKPRQFIKQSPSLQNIECSICYELSEQPYHCKGPCSMIICLNCVDHIRKHYGICPQRCSNNPLSVKPCQNVPIEFVCPFNRQLCPKTFPSVQLFKQHLSECQYVSIQLVKTIQNLNNYRCPQGHDLFFLTEQGLFCLYREETYKKAQNSFCQNCKETTLCRSICPQCSTKQKFILFCCKCCRPPCTKTCCLYQHEWVKQEIHSFSNTCDYCAKPSRLYGIQGYRDTECNFDICEACYELLPEEHERVPEQMQLSCIKHLHNFSINKQISQMHLAQQLPVSSGEEDDAELDEVD